MNFAASSRSSFATRSAAGSRQRVVSVKAGFLDFLDKKEPQVELKKAAPAKAKFALPSFGKAEVVEKKKAAPVKAKFSLPFFGKSEEEEEEVAPAKANGFSFPFFGKSDDDEEEARPAKKTVKKAASKTVSKYSRKVKPYSYIGNGIGQDKDFSTVEMDRTGKMRPDNIDLEKPRSFWN